MCPLLFDLKELSQVSHSLLIQLILLLKDYILELLKLSGIRSEDALNNVIVELLLVQLLSLVKEHKMFFEVLHHVPLAK